MANGVTVQKYIFYFVKDSSSPLSFLLVAEFNSKGCKKLSSFSPLILEALSKSLCDIVVYNKKYILHFCPVRDKGAPWNFLGDEPKKLKGKPFAIYNHSFQPYLSLD